MFRTLIALGGAAAMLAGLAPAGAQETVKVGLIMPYSGQFADTATQMDNAIKLYMKEHGDMAGGKKIELIRKDTGGIAPDVAKRLAQELVVRDKVDILAGFILTPNALAAADVSVEAEKFMVVMNAATQIITTKSPFMARTSVTTPQLNRTLGEWAVKNRDAKRFFTMVSDYGPGHDAEGGFIAGVKAAGGEIVDSIRMPVANPDFSAFVQRAKDAGTDSIYVWVPGGAQPPAIGKALAERGINAKETHIFGQDEFASDPALESMGDKALGIITVAHYSHAHESDMNRSFVKSFREISGGRNPDIFSIGGYDGMHLIYAVLEKTGGDTGGQALIDAAKGMAWESPRGPISIDAETRDITQTVYIREVQKVDGVLKNVEIDTVEKVKAQTEMAPASAPAAVK